MGGLGARNLPRNLYAIKDRTGVCEPRGARVPDHRPPREECDAVQSSHKQLQCEELNFRRGSHPGGGASVQLWLQRSTATTRSSLPTRLGYGYVARSGLTPDSERDLGGRNVSRCHSCSLTPDITLDITDMHSFGAGVCDVIGARLMLSVYPADTCRRRARVSGRGISPPRALRTNSKHRSRPARTSPG